MSIVISPKALIIGGSPTLLQPIVSPVLDPTTGLVSTATANVGINIECFLGAFSDDFDWVEILLQNLDLPLPNWVTIHGPIQFMLPAAGNSISVSIPAPANTGGFLHGRFQLRVQLFVNEFGDPATGTPDRPGDVGEFSLPAAFTVDRIAPYATANGRDQPPIALYTGTLPPGAPITATFLSTSGGLPFTIFDNAYPTQSGQWALGDTIRYYWSPNLFPQPQFEVGALIPARPMLQAGNTFLLPASAIPNNNGTWNFFYTITDLAGNVSRPSAVAPFTVSLLPAPEQKDIFIPLAPAPVGGSADRLLNIPDYVAGITALVQTYLNHQPTLDQIQLRWGTQPWTTPPVAISTFPLTFNSTTLNALIKAEYGTQKGPQPTDVQYRILRNGEVFNSLVKTVDVDLSVTGPVNPGEPGSVNPNLNAAQIFGQGSLVPNQLTAAHANLPVTVSIVLWTVADLPQAGQFIHLVWSDGTVVQPPFAITTQLPGETITFTIPWSVVAATGNGTQVIQYFVASTATPAATDNRNTAPDTTVNVINAVSLALAPPQYQGVVGTGASAQWTCDSLAAKPQTTPPSFNGNIVVPADSRFVLGQTLTLTVRVFRPRTGPAVEDTTQTFTTTITPAIQASGWTCPVPFALLKSARLGAAQATSSTPIGNVIGRGVANVNVRSVLSVAFCDLSPVVGP
ncbi:hypothetical protein [Pseudomonas costantinii]|uniref:hypothetical protein n=1 Tax=Pseudomonas costantinii TaxID=168469 RepID=UPI0015A0C9BF|nr:hypothetical protein [Pseudomonas costantinii]NVZ71275.1 hypothetical protein [Pseudomonas costantinii]